MTRLFAAMFLMISVAACDGELVPKADTMTSTAMSATAMYNNCVAGTLEARNRAFDPVDRRAAATIYCLVGQPRGRTFADLVDNGLPVLARYPTNPGGRYMDPRALEELPQSPEKTREAIQMWMVLAEEFGTPFTHGSLPEIQSGDGEYLEMPNESLRPELQGLGARQVRLVIFENGLFENSYRLVIRD